MSKTISLPIIALWAIAALLLVIAFGVVTVWLILQPDEWYQAQAIWAGAITVIFAISGALMVRHDWLAYRATENWHYAAFADRIYQFRKGIMQLGIYQHYKGPKYLLIGIAHHTETNELMAVYVPLYEHSGAAMAVRPLAMFQEKVDVDGMSVPRFRFIGATLDALEKQQ